MAETHRRVEPRGIVGTGMLNDPDRLRDIEQRAERFMRDRQLPKRKFGEVIAGAPNTAPEGTELVDEEPTPDRRRKGQEQPDDGKSPPKPAAEAAPQQKAAVFERRGTAAPGMVRPSVAPPKGAQPKTPPAAPRAAAPSTPPPSQTRPAPAQEEKKDASRPLATGSVSPEQAKQTGGHTQVTFKI